MSEAKFTKLKWGIEKDEFDDSGEWFEIHASSEKHYISKHIADVYSGEGDANLIAAAPEMYEMIESLRNELHSVIKRFNSKLKSEISGSDLDEPDYLDEESIHLANLLLAKARGEL